MTENETEEEGQWCERCMEFVKIFETFEDVVQEYAGQRGVKVTALDCGHDISIPDGTFYPFP
jgi:thiol-disulfide isomerase/thioredoxin